MQLPKLDRATFEERIFETKENCLVIFTRKTCRECKVIVPMLEEMADSYLNAPFNFYSVDVEEQVPLFKRFSLRGVPSILFFSKGEHQGKLAGMVEEEQVIEKIEEIC